jgi:hypothetical protein
MKRTTQTLLLLGWLMAWSKADAQSQLNISSFVGGVVFAHVYGPDTNNPGLALTGNISTTYSAATPYGDFPAGTKVYGGTLLGGSATGPTNEFDFTNGYLYTAQLWAAPGDDRPESDLMGIPWYTTTLRTGPTMSSAGFITPLSFTATNPDPGLFSFFGGSATCQLRVWYNGGGAIADWDTAAYSGSLIGASELFNVDDLPLGSDFPPSLPANLAGLRSFNLYLPDAFPTLPIIYAQPISTSAPLGGSVQFGVGEDQGITLQWQFNGTNLTNNARISGANSEVLTIDDVQMADEGSYSVLVKNYLGATNSAAATLAVMVAQPTIEASALANSGNRLTLGCAAVAGQPYQVQYKTNLAQPNWLNFGSPLISSDGTVSATISATNSEEFYRIVLLAQ